MNPESSLQKYRELFNAEEFHDAHEVLEPLWRGARNPVTKLTETPQAHFYQGLIQLAAAFHHLKKQKISSAQKVFESARDHLLRTPDSYEGLSLSGLLETSAKVFSDHGPFPKI